MILSPVHFDAEVPNFCSLLLFCFFFFVDFRNFTPFSASSTDAFDSFNFAVSMSGLAFIISFSAIFLILFDGSLKYLIAHKVMRDNISLNSHKFVIVPKIIIFSIVPKSMASDFLSMIS